MSNKGSDEGLSNLIDEMCQEMAELVLDLQKCSRFNKTSGKRARVSTLNLTKKFKVFRKYSIQVMKKDKNA